MPTGSLFGCAPAPLASRADLGSQCCVLLQRARRPTDLHADTPSASYRPVALALPILSTVPPDSRGMVGLP